MIIFYKSKLAKLLLPNDIEAITIGCMVFTARPMLTFETKNHERTHVAQWTECLFMSLPMCIMLAWQLNCWAFILLSPIMFYLIYGIDYVRLRISGYSHDDAYMLIAFEREAYEHERNESYNLLRKPLAWLSKFK